MHPISKDRLEWVENRLSVLDVCIKELNGNIGRWASIPGAAQYVGRVNESFATERLLLSVEQRVLRAHFDAQHAAAEESRENANGR